MLNLNFIVIISWRKEGQCPKKRAKSMIRGTNPTNIDYTLGCNDQPGRQCCVETASV